MIASAADPIRRIPYGGDALHVLGEGQGLAVCEMTVPPRFPGPPAHVHYGFDEAIYVLEGELTVVTEHGEPEPVTTGSLVLANRGTRHTFSNPGDTPVRVLGIWGPGSALGFMAEIGAALSASGPPNPELLAEIYRRHNGEIAP